MQIIALVNLESGRAARGTADRTTSPHFAAALLSRRLAPLHYHLQVLAGAHPHVWAELAEHLAVPAEAPAVAAEARSRATASLSRRLEADPARARAARHPNGICSP